MAGVNVSGVREARLAATALRSVDRDLRREVNKQTRTVVNPVWRESVDDHGSSRMDERVLRAGARVATGTRPALIGASSRRQLRGGLVPVDDWRAWEFGADRERFTSYRTRSPNGKRYTARRRTRRQLPPTTKGGRVLYPAVSDALPRVAALWSQTAVWLTFEALRKGAD